MFMSSARPLILGIWAPVPTSRPEIPGRAAKLGVCGCASGFKASSVLIHKFLWGAGWGCGGVWKLWGAGLLAGVG